MNLLILITFAVVCIVAATARYPYDDAYVAGDIVPHGIAGHGYGRTRGRYPIKHREGGLYGGRHGEAHHRRNSRYGRNRDVLYRDYRRRYGDYDTYLPPRGIGGYGRPPYDRHGHDYGRDRPHIHRPRNDYDDDDHEISYGGYKKVAGIRAGYN